MAYISAVRFEWDRKKERLNVAKHGVSFREAKELFTSRVARWASKKERVLYLEYMEKQS